MLSSLNCPTVLQDVMDLPAENDNFVWPGEAGFKDFPKRLPQDCVTYTIHVISAIVVTDAQVRSRLKQIRDAANSLVKKYLKNYIWQRDSFSLEVVVQNGGGFLQGKTNFGDSIADEWLIVYLLRELSKLFEDAWIRVSDADGEFLLIEAANALPPWLNPEVAAHRVWIHRGNLRIISLVKNHQKSSAPLLHLREITLKQALTIIRDHPSHILHLHPVEEEAFFRIRNYPGQIKESMHTALISIPRNLAFIIHNTPAHVSPAVEAFYLRDSVSLKALQNSSSDCLKFGPEDLVLVGVQFTRVSYAQLKCQEFPPPAAWKSMMDDSNASHIGMKLACGFELLLSDPQNCDKRPVREVNLLLDDLESGEPLPTDSEIATWSMAEDSDTWLNVNFEDFENELAGRKGMPNRSTSTSGKFGDRIAQENLQKIVERFEQFLNDDDAGPEGAEFQDEMDYDEDEELTDSSSDGEERNESFDEEEFESAMREMMGLPLERKTQAREAGPPISGHIHELHQSDDDDDNDDEEDQIRALSEQMEIELKSLGALNLDSATDLRTALDRTSSDNEAVVDSESSPNFHLAKNILESFRSQAGVAGPVGNMMNLMGLKLPRDEEHG